MTAQPIAAQPPSIVPAIIPAIPASASATGQAQAQVLQGRVAVVTGAGRGLGRAGALALAAAGAQVALLARSEAELHEVAATIEAAGGQALPVPTDVGDEAALHRAGQQVLARLGRVDVLLNNAGMALVRPLLEMSAADLRRVLDVNVVGAMMCAKVFGAPMVAQGSGRIINVGSISGLIGEPGLSAYSASKGALLAFTRALSAEWARYGVTVNALAPGYFHTDLNAAALTDPDIGSRLLRNIPLRRFGEAAELGPLLVYLASPASAFMTGSVLVIDGGQAAR